MAKGNAKITGFIPPAKNIAFADLLDGRISNLRHPLFRQFIVFWRWPSRQIEKTLSSLADNLQVSFWAKEEGEHGVFRYLIGCIGVVVAYISGQIPYLMSHGSTGQSSNEALALILLPFAVAGALLLLVVRFVHQLPPLRMATARPRADQDRLAFGFWVWLGLLAVPDLLGWWLQPEAYRLTFRPEQLPGLLLVALTLLFVQTTTEEYFFRGYLMQGLAKAGNRPWAAVMGSALVFGLLHLGNPEAAQYGRGIMLLYYVGFGLALSALTVLDQGAELAAGVHAATNFYGAVFVSYEGSALSTASLAQAASLEPARMTALALVSGAIFLALAKRRYGLPGLKAAWQELSQPIESGKHNY